MNDAFAACVAGYGSHSPEVLHFGPVFEHSARVAGKVSLMQQISHNRPAADKGIISVARHHLRVNTVSQARMYKAVLPTVGLAESACGYDCE